MMRFINNKIIKGILTEKLQIQGDTLNTAANHVSIGFLQAIRKFTDGYIPKVTKRTVCLIDKLHRVRNKKHSPSASFCIHHSGYRFSRSGSMI